MLDAELVQSLRPVLVTLVIYSLLEVYLVVSRAERDLNTADLSESLLEVHSVGLLGVHLGQDLLQHLSHDFLALISIDRLSQGRMPHLHQENTHQTVKQMTHTE